MDGDMNDESQRDGGSDSDDGASAMTPNEKNNLSRGIGVNRTRRHAKQTYDDDTSNRGTKTKPKTTDQTNKK